MTEPVWQPEFKAKLVVAIVRIEKELPGWWWSVGSCSVSAHASIGPDIKGRDAHLLEHKQFDEGFHADLGQPAETGEALEACIDTALAAKRAVNDAAASTQGVPAEQAGE